MEPGENFGDAPTFDLPQIGQPRSDALQDDPALGAWIHPALTSRVWTVRAMGRMISWGGRRPSVLWNAGKRTYETPCLAHYPSHPISPGSHTRGAVFLG